LIEIDLESSTIGAGIVRISVSSWRPAAVASLAVLLTLTPAGLAGSASAAAPEPALADAQDPAVTTLAKDRGITIAEAQRRIGWQQAGSQLADDLAALGEGFGGLWFDRADGRVKVGVVAAVPRAGAQTRELVERRQLAAATDLVTVRHSLIQLERDSDWLGAATSAANAAGGARLGSALQTDRNRLVLRVPPSAGLSAAQQAVVDTARARLGSRVVVETGATGLQRQACGWSAGDFDCDAPLRGGVRIYQGSTAWCSTAFNARSNSDNLWYVLTAGHCGVKGTEFRAYQPTSGSFHVIGDVHNSTQAGNDDMAIIRINNVPGWNPRNWVYVHASADTVLDPDYTIVNTFNSPVGTRVCISGSTSGTDCGDVVEVNWDGTNGLSRAQYCSDGGDSGGAIYSGHNARGIHVGVVAGHDGDCLNAVFQTVREAASKLNVYVVTS
jgi:streptogrisin C